MRSAQLVEHLQQALIDPGHIPANLYTCQPSYIHANLLGIKYQLYILYLLKRKIPPPTKLLYTKKNSGYTTVTYMQIQGDPLLFITKNPSPTFSFRSEDIKFEL